MDETRTVKRIDKQLAVKQVYPEGLPTHFINNILVKHQEDLFVLEFFQVWPPAIMGATDEEKQRSFDSLKEVESTCVVRLVLTPERMHEIVRALSDNVKNYDKTFGIDRQTKEGAKT